MARQYKRSYNLVISPDLGDSKIIRDLKVTFEITKSTLSFPNLCRISIYNPNPDTIALLNKKYTKITFNAGYEGNVRLLFTGQIRNVFRIKSGQESIITIYAGDGERDWQNATFNGTFSDNVTISKAVDEVLKTFEEVTVGIVQGVPDIADKLLGQTLSGSSKDILDQFANEYGFNWSIQDGEINIVPVESPVQGDEAVLVSAATGMIGSPTLTETGADVTTLLNPNLLPDRAFRIESVNADIQLGNVFFRNINRTNAEGTYKVKEVIFRGDSRDGDWTSTAKGKAISG